MYTDLVDMHNAREKDSSKALSSACLQQFSSETWINQIYRSVKDSLNIFKVYYDVDYKA